MQQWCHLCEESHEYKKTENVLIRWRIDQYSTSYDLHPSCHGQPVLFTPLFSITDDQELTLWSVDWWDSLRWWLKMHFTPTQMVKFDAWCLITAFGLSEWDKVHSCWGTFVNMVLKRIWHNKKHWLWYFLREDADQLAENWFSSILIRICSLIS